MRVFVTGATGYIGHAVAKAFRAKGHCVYGLVRTDEDAHELSANEMNPVVGSLEMPESYRPILGEVEAVVHCAFDYKSGNGVQLDESTIGTVLEVFSKAALPRCFVYTSGIWVYGSRPQQLVDESTPLSPIDFVSWRPSHEEKVLQANSPLIRTLVIRPGCVYGGTQGLMNFLFNSLENGSVSVVGEGNNYWSLIHVEDLAQAYVLAVEKEVGGVAFNVVDDSPATLHEIGKAIARSAKIEGKVSSMTLDEGKKQYGPLAEGLTSDLMISNSRLKRLLGWQCHHASFISEVDLYYRAWKGTQQVKEF